jgi:hypothetical protein
MKTSKENMTEYLEKFQMFQRLLQGVAHVSVDCTVVDSYVSSHDLVIFPLDEGRCFTRTKNGYVIMRMFSVSSYNDKEENDKVMQEAHKYVKSLKPVAA